LIQRGDKSATRVHLFAAPNGTELDVQIGAAIEVAEKVGISDLMFLAYHAMKRESAGKPVKPFDVWMETVVDVTTGDNDPKATSAEA